MNHNIYTLAKYLKILLQEVRLKSMDNSIMKNQKKTMEIVNQMKMYIMVLIIKKNIIIFLLIRWNHFFSRRLKKEKIMLLL